MTSRRQRERAGRFAEGFVALILRLQGYQILKRRYRTWVGEVDLICRRGQTLLFVEVKWRRDGVIGDATLPVGSRERIRRAAEFFLSRFPQYTGFDKRFDLFVVHRWMRVKRLQNAF